jgi:hypothetical protein
MLRNSAITRPLHGTEAATRRIPEPPECNGTGLLCPEGFHTMALRIERGLFRLWLVLSVLWSAG